MTTSPQTIALSVTLPHGTTGDLRIEARDPSGNVTFITRPSTVDVQSPAAPVVTSNITNARRALVELAWTASGDDGLSGTVAGYDVRYTTNAVLPGGIDSAATFFASTGSAPKTKQVDGALQPAATLTKTLTLPPFASYSIHVRAVDEVGNYSPFAVQPMIQNLGREIVLANPGSGNAVRMARGGR